MCPVNQARVPTEEDLCSHARRSIQCCYSHSRSLLLALPSHTRDTVHLLARGTSYHPKKYLRHIRMCSMPSSTFGQNSWPYERRQPGRLLQTCRAYISMDIGLPTSDYFGSCRRAGSRKCDWCADRCRANGMAAIRLSAPYSSRRARLRPELTLRVAESARSR